MALILLTYSNSALYSCNKHYVSIHVSLSCAPRFQAKFLTYFSVIKSRLQAGKEHAKQYRSSLDGLATILREEGVQGLYKGVASKLLQSVLTAAILFACQRRIYELTKKVRVQVSHAASNV